MVDLKRKALIFAGNAHKGATRKSGLPYILHPVSVGLELLENGASSELVAAGFLHDTIEDANITPEEIRREFGDEVLRIVMFDTEDKSLSWEERKNATLKALEDCDDSCAMLILADKLSNIKDIKDSLEKDGDIVWNQFKRGKEKQEWLYRDYLTVCKRLSHLKMYQELEIIVNEVFSKKTYNDRIVISYMNDTTIIELCGRIDSNNVDEYSNIILNANILDNGVILNAKELSYISSAGLRLLLKLKKKLINKNLEMINVNENVMDILELTGFSEILNIK